MMLIIAEKNPEDNFKYITEKTNKNFVFKSFMELAQLICSSGISNIYKPVKQGKELQKWIKENPLWVFRYYSRLWFWCCAYIKMSTKTLYDTYMIKDALCELVRGKKRITYPKTAIFRYKKGYVSKYKSNSELPLEECCKAYREYIETFKFPVKEIENEGNNVKKS